MKLQLKTILTLLLLVTIVFPSLSQKNYIIGNDTIVGYTKEQNRKIAIIFHNRNKLEELNFDNERLIYVLKDSNFKLETNLKSYAYKDSLNNLVIKNLITTANNLNAKLDKEIKSNNTSKKVIKVSVGVNLLLAILLILK